MNEIEVRDPKEIEERYQEFLDKDHVEDLNQEFFKGIFSTLAWVLKKPVSEYKGAKWWKKL